MKIHEIMTKDVLTVDANTTLKEAAVAMRKNNVGALPVRRGNGTAGMVTDRDIVVRAIADGKDPMKSTVADVMSSQLITCFDDQDVEDVVDVMKDKQVRRVLIVDHKNNPVGIVSLGDIAAHTDVNVAAQTLRKVAEPVH